MPHEGDRRRYRTLARERREGGDRHGCSDAQVCPAPRRGQVRGLRERRARWLRVRRVRRGRCVRTRLRGPAERAAEAAELWDRGRGGLERRSPVRRGDRRVRRAAGRRMTRVVTDRLLNAIDGNERAVVFTVIEGEPLGAKALALESGEVVGDGVPPAALEQANELIRAARNRLLELDDARVFAEVYGPPPQLVIIGAVDTADSLCQAAKLLGWQTIVADA